MKKISILLLLSTIWFSCFGQTLPPDRIITQPVPATGTNVNKQSDRYANLTAYRTLYVPKFTSNSLRGGKDSVGAVMYNTTVQKLVVYKGGGVWEELGGGNAYTAGYGLNLTGFQFRADTTLLGTKSWVNGRLLSYAPISPSGNYVQLSPSSNQSGGIKLQDGSLLINRMGQGDYNFDGSKWNNYLGSEINLSGSIFYKANSNHEFYTNGNVKVMSLVSGKAYLDYTPTTDTSPTQILTRDATTGEIKKIDASSIVLPELQNLDSIGFANIPFPKSRKTWMGSNAATGTQSVEFTMKGSSRFSNILALQSISDTTFAAIAFRDKGNYEHFAVGYDASSPAVIVLPTQGKAFLEANTLPTGNPLTEIPPALALFQSGNIRGSGWAQHLRFELDTTGKASFHNLLLDSIDFQIDNINGETYHRKIANFKDGLVLDSLNGKYIMFKSNGDKTALFGNNYNLLGTGSTTDLNTFVYGNNPYSIWTNGVKRFSIDGSGVTTIGTALSFLNNTAQKAIDWGGNEADFSSFGGNIGAFTGFDNTTGTQKLYQLSYIKTALDLPTNTNTSLASKENTSNKQNSLATDGTGAKFPTVDAVNAALGDFVTTNTFQGVAASKQWNGNQTFAGNVDVIGANVNINSNVTNISTIKLVGRGGGSPLKPYFIINPSGATNVSPTSTDIPSGFDGIVLYNKKIADGTSHFSWKTRKVASTDIEDFGATIVQSGLTADRNYVLPDANGTVSLAPIVDTGLTTTQTSSSLNALYPSAVVGQQITAPNVGTGMKYEKINTTSGGTWIAWVTTTI